MDYISLIGNIPERAKQLGEIFFNKIQELINYDQQYIHFNKPQNLEHRVEKYRNITEKYLPDVALFINELAKSSNVNTNHLWALQYRRELSEQSDDCSLFASTQNAIPFIAQTIDLQNFIHDKMIVFSEQDESSDTRTVTLSPAGLAGYLGMNNHGIAIGINMVRSKDWQVGITPYLLIRHLLTLKTTEECLSCLSELPRSSSRCLVILENNLLTVVEMTAKELRYWTEINLPHTNHFIHPELELLDKEIKTPSSNERLDYLNRKIGTSSQNLSNEKLLQIFSSHSGINGSLCCHGLNPQSADTVAFVIMRPEIRSIYVALDYPCKSIELREIKL